MRTAVIFNPRAGREQGIAIATQVEQILTGHGHQVELLPTQGPNEAQLLARRVAWDVDIVVAVGGDGTINEVVNGLTDDGHSIDSTAIEDAVSHEAATRAQAGARAPAKLGVVPAGTVNVLAIELDIPFDTAAACAVINRGNTMLLDLGRVNERRFTLMMGAGIDALTIRNIDLQQKRRFRELAFLGTGLKAGLTDRPPVFLVRVNEREYRTTFLVAANTRNYAGRFGITPGADPSDGLLDLVLFTGTTRAGLAVFWMGVPSGLHLRNPDVISLRARHAELTVVEGEETVWLQTDGELVGSLPATVAIDHHALEVLVP